jgi:hypothetical protein
MAICVPTVASPPQAPPFTTAPESADFDQRWAAWQAKGAVHDRVRRKMAMVAPILITVAAVIIYALLGR